MSRPLGDLLRVLDGKTGALTRSERVRSSGPVAVSGKAALLTSQFALPEAECRAVYGAEPLYAASVGNLERVSLSRDGIFRDASEQELAAQMLVLEGNPAAGYRATGRVGVVV